MALKTFYLHPVTLGSTEIDCVTAVEVNPGLEWGRPLADGNIDPYTLNIMAQNPRIGVETRSIAEALAAVPFATATGSCTAYEAQVSAGVKAGSGSHTKHAMAASRHIPRSLSVRQGENASFRFEAIGYTAAGGNAPLLTTFDESLAAHSPGSEHLWTLGPVQIEGAVLEGVEGFTLDFAIGELVRAADGFTAPKAIEIMSRLPILQIDCSDMDQIDAAVASTGVSGSPISTAAVIYLRKRTADGLFVADATTSHIKITFAAGAVQFVNIGGDYPRRAGLQLLARRGAAASIQIDTASAIT